MAVLGGVAVSYERGTHVHVNSFKFIELVRCISISSLEGDECVFAVVTLRTHYLSQTGFWTLLEPR